MLPAVWEQIHIQLGRASQGSAGVNKLLRVFDFEVTAAAVVTLLKPCHIELASEFPDCLFQPGPDQIEPGAQVGILMFVQVPGGPKGQKHSFVRRNGGHNIFEDRTDSQEPGVHQ